MANLPSVYNQITIEEVSFDQAITENTAYKIGTSINKALDDSYTKLGDIKSSFLSLYDFQNIWGAGWVRAYGQSISGSALHTLSGISTLPNMIGRTNSIYTYSAEFYGDSNLIRLWDQPSAISNIVIGMEATIPNNLSFLTAKITSIDYSMWDYGSSSGAINLYVNRNTSASLDGLQLSTDFCLINSNGTTTHLQQSNNDASIGGFLANQNLAHTHNQVGFATGSGGYAYDYSNLSTAYVAITSDSNGGSVFRPNSYQTNFFVRIN